MSRAEGLPLRRAGNWRKRWRYVGAYDDTLMLCAAVVEIGPLRQAFWAVWDRERRELVERTRIGLPGRRREVTIEGDRVAVRAREVTMDLSLAPSTGIEARCPNGRGAETWTRKRAGFAVEGEVALAGRRHEMRARGVDDESAGYHPRHTSWLWSAGVGEGAGGRPVAWNLVTGINDPPTGSERAIWIDGVPTEPPPVEFEALDAIRFADGARLTFEAEASRARRDSLPPLFRSEYEAPFGTFGGSLGGEVELDRGYGVMERHDALW